VSARVFKRCGCGRTHTRAEWLTLPFVGLSYGLELRNCACGSTIAVRATVEPYGAIAAGHIGFGLTRAAARADAVLRAIGGWRIGGATC